MGEYIKDQTLSTTASAGDYFVFDSATNTHKITRQNLIGQMDTNQTNIASNTSNISDISDQVDLVEITANANESNIIINDAKILALESEINSRQIWQGASSVGDANVYCKIGTINLTATGSEFDINFDTIVNRDGRDYTENMYIGVAQLSALGVDPTIYSYQRRFEATVFDLGLVIESNAGPVVVGVWLKYTATNLTPVIWLQSLTKTNSALTLIASPVLVATEPTGISYATKQKVTTTT